MKKILSLLLALTLVFALVACSNEKDTTSEPDTSTPTTQTESSDDTETTDSNTTDGSSSDTETPSNSTPTNTGTSTPATSNKDNTTSTPTTSSKPSTSKPSSSTTTTEKPTTSTTTPSTSTPSTPSTPTVTKPDFDDIDPRSIYAMVMTNPTAKSLSAEQVINFCLADLYWDNTTNVSSARLYEVAQNHFVVDENLKQLLKSSSAYDSSTDTYNINLGKYDQFYMGWMAGKIKSYEDLGNNQYMIYGTCKEESLYDSGSVFDTVNYKTYTFKAKVSKSGSKTIIHTFEIINSIPSGITEY